VRKSVVLSGAFDDLRSIHVRLLQEAARLGPVHILLWSDEQVEVQTGRPPKFLQQERLYLLDSLRYVQRVTIPAAVFDPEALPDACLTPKGWPPAGLWAGCESEDSPGRRSFARARGLDYRVIRAAQLAGFPAEEAPEFPGKTPRSSLAAQPERTHPRGGPARPSGNRPESARPRVLVSGCFDWFHSGHVRFFEEVSALGELYVVVGHDANVRLLKGQGHPLFPQEERRYLVAAVRHVRQALVSSGNGWLDAEPEIRALCPDLFAVNEDGDQPEKREYCKAHGIGYVVLRRNPREGLPRRQSTDLRGF
jgi:cytidyltransferase-like protein